MKETKFFLTGLLLCCMILLMVSATYGAENTEKALDNLQSELREEGMSVSDISGIKKPVKEMLKKGANKDELRAVLLDLSKNGVKGKDLKSSVDSMDNLIKSGKSPKEAGNIVSEAVHQAQAQGLRGTALADRVHQAVHQMQAQKNKAKEVKKEQREMNRTPKKTEEGTEKGSEMQGRHMHGGMESGMSRTGGGHGHR